MEFTTGAIQDKEGNVIAIRRNFLAVGVQSPLLQVDQNFMPKPIPDEKIIAHIDKLIPEFRGNIAELEQAVGVWIVGRHFGWRVMLLVHDRKTLAKYEEKLRIDFREELPEVGPYAKKSLAWTAVQKVSNFWKAVRGEIPNIKTPEIK